ncbi:hypothetical protein DCO58_11190 [Helicobacter saguini]|uniref:RCK C-terminal domain-containing protein n=2 Tax=Helicobacter saguini TaxID=1548018 RepID=A0A347VU09_9HELI|nr:hypothetical protein [Helicobacter saguini]MWV68191.1 hypothetical protein [Helicobacter saguini]MWV70345.1 hypothetical protein [Helicobacter saguini]MWV72247.1 hypothetical protein [Helicobacter saguini]TLD95360.1 hypothetical protein LS64_002785 [Helicobacter saguini]
MQYNVENKGWNAYDTNKERTAYNTYNANRDYNTQHKATKENNTYVTNKERNTQYTKDQNGHSRNIYNAHKEQNLNKEHNPQNAPDSTKNTKHPQNDFYKSTQNTHKKHTQNRLDSNNDLELPKEYPSTFKFFYCDYTSYFRLDSILGDYDISDAFIVLDSESEGKVVYEYLRKTYKNIRIIQSIHALNDYYENLKRRDSNLILITQTNAMASRLLLRMPNVPVIPRGFGLEQGELMEIGIPSGSILAHRQISTIRQQNWRVVGIYRRNEFILSSHHLVINPGDTILVAGKPEALKNLYTRIKSEMGQFPSPFGREMYLIIDMALQKRDRIFFDCKEAIFLHRHLKSSKLTIKVLHAGDFGVINEIQQLAKNDIFVSIDYDNLNFTQVISNKTDKKVGLIILGKEMFHKRAFRKILYASKIPVFRSGENALAPENFDMWESRLIKITQDSKDSGNNENISLNIMGSKALQISMNNKNPAGKNASGNGAKDSKAGKDFSGNAAKDSKKSPTNVAYSLLVIAGDSKKNSDISTLIFDISKQLGLDVNVYDFEPDNHFNAEIDEEFSNLSRIFERPFHIEKNNAINPMFYLQNLNTPILHFVPFTESIARSRFISLFKTNFEGLAYNLDSNPQFYLPIND